MTVANASTGALVDAGMAPAHLKSVEPLDTLTHPMAAESTSWELRRILGLSVPVTVTLAERQMDVRSILEITIGTILEFDVPFNAELTLQVANRPISSGQAVKVGENFGIRITRVHAVQDRIGALGGSRPIG